MLFVVYKSILLLFVSYKSNFAQFIAAMFRGKKKQILLNVSHRKCMQTRILDIFDAALIF